MTRPRRGGGAWAGGSAAAVLARRMRVGDVVRAVWMGEAVPGSRGVLRIAPRWRGEGPGFEERALRIGCWWGRSIGAVRQSEAD